MTPRFAGILTGHPAQPGGALESLTAAGSLQAGGRMALEFDLRGDLQRLRLPAPVPVPLRRDELWRHTCFECFAGPLGQPGYLELNFSPSGHWAAYRFAGYRTARTDLPASDVTVRTQSLGARHLRVSASATLGPELDPAAGDLQGAAWQLNIAAVLEDGDGRLAYWAVHHTEAQPDFHARDGFRITLANQRT